MKNGNMSKIYASAVMIMMVVISCGDKTKFEEDSFPTGQNLTIRAIIADEDTRTTIIDGGTKVYWQPGDAIMVCRSRSSVGSTKYFSADIDELSPTANFIGNEPNGSGDLIGIYPYRLALGESLEVDLPNIQTAVAGSFANGLYITAGRSSTTNMKFYAVCGGFRFTVKEEGIRMVAFEALGNTNIVGRGRIDFSGERPQAYAYKCTGLSSRIVLLAPEGESFLPGKWYYIVAFPATLSNGYKITLYKKGQWSQELYPDPRSIKRGSFGSKQSIDEDASYAGYSYVDLGLSVMWATCNVGATAPENMGDCYAWGEVYPKYEKYYQWSHYKWCNGHGYLLTKYNLDSYNGDVDNKASLDSSDDAATANWGSPWRTPTAIEFSELLENCTWEVIKLNGVYCMKGTSQMPGYTDKSIILPEINARAIWWERPNLPQVDYWTSTLGSSSSQLAFEASVYESKKISVHECRRCNGMAIRPVIDY